LFVSYLRQGAPQALGGAALPMSWQRPPPTLLPLLPCVRTSSCVHGVTQRVDVGLAARDCPALIREAAGFAAAMPCSQPFEAAGPVAGQLPSCTWFRWDPHTRSAAPQSGNHPQLPVNHRSVNLLRVILTIVCYYLPQGNYIRERQPSLGWCVFECVFYHCPTSSRCMPGGGGHTGSSLLVACA
jgi:hypothetical protein